MKIDQQNTYSPINIIRENTKIHLEPSLQQWQATVENFRSSFRNEKDFKSLFRVDSSCLNSFLGRKTVYD